MIMGNLEKFVYLDNNSSIGNVVIDTTFFICPKNTNEIINITTYIAKICSNALLKSQQNNIQQFTVDVYLKNMHAKDISYEFMKYLAEFLKTLFPERLSEARLIDPPQYFKAAYKLIKPFIDKRTRQKIITQTSTNSSSSSSSKNSSPNKENKETTSY